MNAQTRRSNDDLALPSAVNPKTLGAIVGRYPTSELLDLVALNATGGRADASTLITKLEAGASPNCDEYHLALFAWLIASTARDERDLKVALDAYQAAFSQKSQPRVSQIIFNTWLRALGVTGTFETADPRPSERQVSETDWWAVQTDNVNPFRHNTPFDSWLKSFNSPFAAAGLAPLELSEHPGSPFARLRGSPGDDIDGPLVSVVMPVYNPDSTLLQSVASILDQTWKNLEVLLVDDGSNQGLDYFFEAEALDQRVSLIRSKRNGGAYSARNLGLAAAQGEFLTFQDADDYSHPQRIERLVQQIFKNGSVAAVGRGVRATDDLSITTLNFRHISINLSSLIFRREPVLRRLGAYDPVRRGADSEFSYRLQLVFGRQAVSRLDYPLAVLRRTPGSLSGGEIGLFHRHPARVLYHATSEAWRHSRMKLGSDPRVFFPSRPSFPAPSHIEGTAPRPYHADVVLFAPIEPGVASDVSQIVAPLIEIGARVSLREHLAPIETAQRRRNSKNAMGSMFLSGRATWALPGEQVRGRLGVIQNPLSLLVMPEDPIEVDRAVLIAEEVLSVETVEAIEGRLREVSSAEMLWLPSTPEIATHLATVSPSSAVLPAAWWRIPTTTRVRDHYKGHHLGAIEESYIGGPIPRELQPTRFPLWHLGPANRRDFAANIVRIPDDQANWSRFLSQVGAIIHPEVPTISGATIDAWHSGVLVIAPPAMESVLGNKALYCEGDIDAFLETLAENPAPATEAIQAAQKYCDTNLSPLTLFSTFMSLDKHAQ